MVDLIDASARLRFLQQEIVDLERKLAKKEDELDAAEALLGKLSDYLETYFFERGS